MNLIIELTDSQAASLAQLCKRFCHEDAERLSNRFGNGKERDDMMSAIHVLGKNLGEADFNPR